MKSINKVLAGAAAAVVLFTGCVPLLEEQTTPTDTLENYDALDAYLDSSEDKIEVQPERQFITYYYNLGEYVATAEEIAEEMVEDIDLSMFSFFPTSNSSRDRYSPEKAERTILKESDDYQFRWSYEGSGQELLEKGLEYYGTETEIDGQTYYITEVTERMVVPSMPEGEGLDVIFYQVVWTQDDYLFFVKLPKKFAETVEEIPF